MVEMELHIDKQFKELLPEHSKDEYDQLEANIVEEGRVHDPIIYWHDGKRNLIVDGMTRFDIAKPKGIPFRTEPKEFPSREAVKIWILNNALGRRNLVKPQDQRKVRGELYNLTKRQDGGHGDQKSGDQIERPIRDSAQNIAEKSGVSAPTVRRDGKYVESLRKLVEPVRKAFEGNRLKLSDDQLHALATLDSDKQQAVARAVRTGSKVEKALEKAGAKLNGKAKKKDAPGEYQPKNSDSVKDDTEKCPNCGCIWWKPTKDGHDCDNCCHPMGEPAGDKDEHESSKLLGDLEQKRLSKAHEKKLKNARAALGVLIRYCDEMKLKTKAQSHLEALAKLIGK